MNENNKASKLIGCLIEAVYESLKQKFQIIVSNTQF